MYNKTFDKKEFTLKKTILQPEIISHLGEEAYRSIHELIITDPKQKQVIIEHIYVDQCSRLSYIMFILAPMIAILVVFRVSYGWKSSKVVRMHQPGRFFKG